MTKRPLPTHPGSKPAPSNPTAGAYSPFTLKLARDDGTQRITGVDTTLPRGPAREARRDPLLLRTAPSPPPPGKTGKEEQASPVLPEPPRESAA